MLKWNKKKLNEIIDLCKEGKSYGEIAEITNNSRDAVRNALNRNGYKSSNFEIKQKTITNCFNCKKPFLNPRSKKRFCSHSCAASYNNIINVKYNYCIICGKKIPSWRKYCSLKCFGKANRKNSFYRLENGKKVGEKTIKRYLIHKFGNKCMECGWDKINPITGNVPIQLDHVDGNSENNNLNNLKLLCPNCHSLTPTFGALNKGRGREKRRLQRRIKKTKNIINVI